MEVGAVIYLKSGGPAMTVAKVNESSVDCLYQTKYGLKRAHLLPLVCVTEVPPTGAGSAE